MRHSDHATHIVPADGNAANAEGRAPQINGSSSEPARMPATDLQPLPYEYNNRMDRIIFFALMINVAAPGQVTDPPLPTTAPPGHNLALGPWRAWLESPGGELPFELGIGQDDRAQWQAFVVNGARHEKVPIVNVVDDKLILGFDQYDASIVGTISADGRRVAGEWKILKRKEEYHKLPFQAVAGEAPRFAQIDSASTTKEPPAFDGRWQVEFSKGADTAVGQFAVGPDGRVTGTFLTTSGDYRYLAGRVDGPRLRLSTFDGAHAFLFDARLDEQGVIRGDFWSGEQYHDTWTARRDANARLPDGFRRPAGGCEAQLDRLVFYEYDGTKRALADPLFAGRAMVVEIFGSWCPNCHDAADYLVELHHRYRERGLIVVGVAFELTGNFLRDAKQVKRFAAVHGVEFPLLIGGIADREVVQRAFPWLEPFGGYPTTVFIDGAGRVRAVHSGFAGPATGDEHRKLRALFESMIEELLAANIGSSDESPSTSPPAP